jgi:anaerobic ribonucleoside-triphosphate reductase activating protein
MFEIEDALDKHYIDGITILGGDPFEPENIETVTAICEAVHKLCPGKSIWVYTGYLYEDISLKKPEILNYIDVLVDGPFIEELKDITLQFRGSSNQRIIDVPESLKSGEVKLWRD